MPMVPLKQQHFLYAIWSGTVTLRKKPFPLAALSRTHVLMFWTTICSRSPPGLAGEIYIGGDGLARGYWRLPELTAEKFVPCPFSNEPGRRLYRTGDIGRYKSDGSIVFGGRADAQVKVRGYRIELGEIEASLLQHRAVKEAVVVAFEENGDKQLVGYVSPKQEADLQVGEIKMWLKRRLPEYMVPGRIVALDKMPLTENGKIDRRNLPKPTYGDQAQHEYSAPRTWIEEILC